MVGNPALKPPRTFKKNIKEESGPRGPTPKYAPDLGS